jgi:deazaflavin-dependent oxidoreductase (nitroreductase family)
MPLHGEYEPSPEKWVRDQVERYEATGGREANTLPGRTEPVVVFSTRGARSGKVRKNPLMRVEHDGVYAMVASKGGSPEHPTWYHNLKAHPDQVTVQDGEEVWDGVAREVHGEERAVWWERAVAAFPDYADYEKRTDREIPVFVVERKTDSVERSA